MLPTDAYIREILRSQIPGVLWTAKRVTTPAMSAWRVFSGRRDGIKYEVQVLSWWPDGDTLRVSEYTLFIDGNAVVVDKGIVFEAFVIHCVAAILKQSREAQTRSDKLRSALKRA